MSHPHDISELPDKGMGPGNALDLTNQGPSLDPKDLIDELQVLGRESGLSVGKHRRRVKRRWDNRRQLGRRQQSGSNN